MTTNEEFLAAAAAVRPSSAAEAAAPASSAPMRERELVDMPNEDDLEAALLAHASPAGAIGETLPPGPRGHPGPLGPPGFTPPPITGYRTLSPTEVALMNEGKALADAVGHQIDCLEKYSADLVDKRSLALARSHLQTGFMWLSRSVAKPTNFG